ncbi:PF20097 family protein [Thiocapsa bogorovii]|uniref:PF20097 family protein n=1 Tax=Thiocapsa bogorovii TaxID=521689 RepID=UPI001E34A6D0|nr:PF20097 family protein [Thiocapsa bogorovii]UHD16736.1 PF20097 family protein [Thiocapsa bogorovii]
MSANFAILIGASAAIAALLALWAIVRHLQGKACEIHATADLWSGRRYACPDCGTAMDAGWVMLGKGAIWSSREQGPPGTFAHIGRALPNTISMSLRPAVNMAWRCPSCRLVLIDYTKLVKPAGRGGTA